MVLVLRIQNKLYSYCPKIVFNYCFVITLHKSIVDRLDRILQNALGVWKHCKHWRNWKQWRHCKHCKDWKHWRCWLIETIDEGLKRYLMIFLTVWIVFILFFIIIDGVTCVVKIQKQLIGNKISFRHWMASKIQTLYSKRRGFFRHLWH